MDATPAAAPPPLPPFLRVLHWGLILNFLINILYGGYQVFFVIVPEGHAGGPLFGAASGMPFEDLVVRRLYASEVWISTAGLAIYLAITEYLPRLLRRGA